jgi:excisionase family DNA binding protein
MGEQYLTAAQMAERLQVNRTTLWRWEKQGLLKATKIGKTKRYDPKDLKK